MEQTELQQAEDEERRKKKIRVRYRERVRLKERPAGYRLKQFLRKNKVTSAMLVLTVIGTIVISSVGIDETLEALSALWTGMTQLLYGRD